MSSYNLAEVFGMAPEDLRWMRKANCRNMDIDLFFPGNGENINAFTREVCGECEVRDECLWYANRTFSSHGVFGGMSPNQRESWRTRNKVQLGMSKEAWIELQQSNLLHTPPSEWRQDVHAI